MSRASLSRLAKTSGLDPTELAVALLDRGIEINDFESDLDGPTRKAAKAVVKELRGGPTVVRPTSNPAPAISAIDPKPRASALVGTLSAEDVLFIHERLCADFAASNDPIDPPGLRSRELLESAVSRQESGFGDLMKYPDPVLNAATLLYGVCNDHPFYNGNKRTALVATLAHLDRNRLVLASVKQRDLFRLMVQVADHSIVRREVKVGRRTERLPRRATPDEEVLAIAAWLSDRLDKVVRGEKQITYRQLRQILVNFGYQVLPGRGNKMSICRTEVRRGLLRRTARPKTLMALDWPGDGRTVGVGKIKHIRRTLALCEEDGVPSDAFYGTGLRIDQFINEYRQVLRKLASR